MMMMCVDNAWNSRETKTNWKRIKKRWSKPKCLASIKCSKYIILGQLQPRKKTKKFSLSIAIISATRSHLLKRLRSLFFMSTERIRLQFYQQPKCINVRAPKKIKINIFMVNFRLLHAQFSRMTRHEMGYWACIFWRGVNETLNECADSRLIQCTKMHDYNGYADEIDKNDLIWMYDIELKVGILCGKWKSLVFNNEKKI